MLQPVAKKPDAVFVGLLFVIVAFGFVMLTSASGPSAIQKFHDPYWYVKHQALFGLLPGVIAFVVASRVHYRVWRTLAVPLALVSFFLLLLVFVPGIGATWGTSKSWIHVGNYSLQPVEFVKLTFLVYLAAWFERRSSQEVADFSTGLVPFLAAVGVVALLLMLQPDLGSLLVIAGVAITVYFLAGAPFFHLAGLAAAGAGLIFLAIKAAPYRAARFMTFLHPELDPQGIGYHVNQAFLAIGSGGLFGLGLGHSRQKFLYLPEAVGDSIFAVAAEELGFIVIIGFFLLLLAFLLRGIAIAKAAPDKFSAYLVSGIVAWVFVQTLFNIGSMLGLLPLTGLPLPFISYGGTALMVLLGAMGIVVNVSRHASAHAQ